MSVKLISLNPLVIPFIISTNLSPLKSFISDNLFNPSDSDIKDNPTAANAIEPNIIIPATTGIPAKVNTPPKAVNIIGNCHIIDEFSLRTLDIVSRGILNSHNDNPIAAKDNDPNNMFCANLPANANTKAVPPRAIPSIAKLANPTFATLSLDIFRAKLKAANDNDIPNIAQEPFVMFLSC